MKKQYENSCESARLKSLTIVVTSRTNSRFTEVQTVRLAGFLYSYEIMFNAECVFSFSSFFWGGADLALFARLCPRPTAKSECRLTIISSFRPPICRL